MFVGTKRQAQNVIAKQAVRVGMPYVNHRWLGGMLTNFQTISKRLARLEELEGIDYEGKKSNLTKKELLLLEREKNKLQTVLGGIKKTKRTPDAVFIVDTNKEHLAIDEAHKLGIPVIAIADTDCNPDDIDYAIPGNDDAIASVELLTTIIADAVADGLKARTSAVAATTTTEGEAPKEGEPEPLAEWEQELLKSEATK
ncbi:MAG: 30S ribosomal protein S2, partial [Candidatus Ancillula sp.]|jgi:small subunit ribosomal protein S2|nr:30S ribosomal protein S2 [Candidatus Ancillula sp.]